MSLSSRTGSFKGLAAPSSSTTATTTGPSLTFDKMWRHSVAPSLDEDDTGIVDIPNFGTLSRCKFASLGSYTDTTATLENSSIRCSKLCGVKESVRARIRYNRGERLSIGLIAQSSAPGSGNRFYRGSAAPGFGGTAGAFEASLMCNGEVHLPNVEEGQDSVLRRAPTFEARPPPLFAPGQVVVAVIDRRSNLFLIGMESPYQAPLPVFALPPIGEGGDNLEWGIVSSHMGFGDLEIELVAPGGISAAGTGTGGSFSSSTASNVSAKGNQQLWERDGSKISCYLHQRSSESASELEKLAEAALSTLDS